MRYTGINHLALVTRDMDATIRFWRDLLRMRLVAGLGRPGYRHYFLEISETDLLAFFEWPQVEPVPEKDHGVPVAGPFAFDHVSIGVRERDDLWEIKDALEAAGFWASEIIDHGFIFSLYAFDPNNIAIEWSCPVPGGGHPVASGHGRPPCLGRDPGRRRAQRPGLAPAGAAHPPGRTAHLSRRGPGTGAGRRCLGPNSA